MSNQALAENGSTNPLYTGALAPAITIGFGAAVIMWVIAWVLHMPGVSVPNLVAIPLLMLQLLFGLGVYYAYKLATHPSAQRSSGSFSFAWTG